MGHPAGDPRLKLAAQGEGSLISFAVSNSNNADTEFFHSNTQHPVLRGIEDELGSGDEHHEPHQYISQQPQHLGSSELPDDDSEQVEDEQAWRQRKLVETEGTHGKGRRQVQASPAFHIRSGQSGSNEEGHEQSLVSCVHNANPSDQRAESGCEALNASMNQLNESFKFTLVQGAEPLDQADNFYKEQSLFNPRYEGGTEGLPTGDGNSPISARKRPPP